MCGTEGRLREVSFIREPAESGRRFFIKRGNKQNADGLADAQMLTARFLVEEGDNRVKMLDAGSNEKSQRSSDK